MSVDLVRLVARFTEVFAPKPQWFARAPGRVNLIGEHIDYNGGWVLPAAINRDVAMVAGPSVDGQFHLRSETYDQDFSSPGNSLPGAPVDVGWPNYFLAVLEQFQLRGMSPPPLSVVIDGDVPAAAGLSSSAAYEVCAARLFLAVLERTLPGPDLALLAQAAEHSRWVGVQCGIMDQFISVNGKRGHALKIDCRTLESFPVPLDPQKGQLLLIHSTVKRELATSAYNERRRECEEALALLNDLAGLRNSFLTEYTPSDFDKWGERVPEPLRRRARHVISEQARVLDCERLLNAGDLAAVGELLNASHRSLSDDYEVSCSELDSIHEIASGLKGVYGCRMTGAGFGGCAVALVEPSRAGDLAQEVAATFAERWGTRPWTLLTPACDGAAGGQNPCFNLGAL
jgi:galactokinase